MASGSDSWYPAGGGGWSTTAFIGGVNVNLGAKSIHMSALILATC